MPQPEQSATDTGVRARNIRVEPIERDPLKGVIIMLVSIALFSIMNGMVKDEAKTFPVNQIVFFRNSLALPILFVLIASTGGFKKIKTQFFGRQAAHAATFSCSLACSFTAFGMMPLAESTAISFLSPLIVILLAGSLLRERVGLASWIAVCSGFLGVMLIVRPGAIHANLGAAFALASAFIGAINLLQQRRLSLTDDTLTILFWFLLLSTLYFLPTLFIWWVQPTFNQLLGLVTMGLASGIFQYVSLRPLHYANASTLAPARYTTMLWSILIGFIWFGDVPTTTMLAGSAIVMGSTALTLRRKGSMTLGGKAIAWLRGRWIAIAATKR